MGIPGAEPVSPAALPTSGRMLSRREQANRDGRTILACLMWRVLEP
jgi:hypothetical protein